MARHTRPVRIVGEKGKKWITQQKNNTLMIRKDTFRIRRIDKSKKQRIFTATGTVITLTRYQA